MNIRKKELADQAAAQAAARQQTLAASSTSSTEETGTKSTEKPSEENLSLNIILSDAALAEIGDPQLPSSVLSTSAKDKGKEKEYSLEEAKKKEEQLAEEVTRGRRQRTSRVVGFNAYGPNPG